jgi:hypothetical protein
MSSTEELRGIYESLIEVYTPFAEPGNDWRDGEEGLDALLTARDQALESAQPLLDRLPALWASWEAESHSDVERLSIGQARNRLITLGVEVSRSDTRIERVLQEKIDRLKIQATESNNRNKANQAYSRTILSNKGGF